MVLTRTESDKRNPGQKGSPRRVEGAHRYPLSYICFSTRRIAQHRLTQQTIMRRNYTLPSSLLGLFTIRQHSARHFPGLPGKIFRLAPQLKRQTQGLARAHEGEGSHIGGSLVLSCAWLVAWLPAFGRILGGVREHECMRAGANQYKGR